MSVLCIQYSNDREKKSLLKVMQPLTQFSNACSECKIMEMIDFRNTVDATAIVLFISFFHSVQIDCKEITKKSRNYWHIFWTFFKFQSIPIWGIENEFSWTFQTYVVVCHNFILIWFITIQTMFSSLAVKCTKSSYQSIWIIQKWILNSFPLRISSRWNRR